MPAERAWIGLGSNLDDPPARLRAALAAIDRLPETRRVATSPFYRTAPLGPADQPDFCNAVTAIDTGLEPPALLDALQAIEAAAGRVRTRRWGPRTLDLDILLYGERRIAEPRLTVPHPRLHERAFVLVPLAALAPDAYVPGRGRVAALAAAVGDDGVEPWEAA
ncbi:2-amino-4-hydroxy-6-hydroxymethyldihydropteridine diphosphokinase [Salinisphaera sp. PC39]|uniref:2-amino-4-hydroxy-6- hydroxymethyldihydropteridine diphosphokinase n=1 Tax=Salinisphaera sp. PC39 TaxID=1304156 RepID=UPI00333FEB8C